MARSTLVLSLPGDRRDGDLVATMRAAGWATRFVFHDQRERRGRHLHEAPKLLACCVPPGKEHRVAADAREAILEGLRLTPAGEALVVVADLGRGGARDEDTAVVVENDERFRVLGTGGVYVFDATANTYTSVSDLRAEDVPSIHDVRLHVLGRGDEFALKARRPVRPREPTT